MRVTLLVIAFAFELSAQPFDFRATTENPAVLAALQDLGVRGFHRFDQREVAAFIVKDDKGLISCLMWPHSAALRSEHYLGVIPNGTVAIAHTHPLRAAEPSRGDVAESKRIGLPIYVITRWCLYAVDPASGDQVRLIYLKDWARPVGSSRGCKTDWFPQPAEVQAARN